MRLLRLLVPGPWRDAVLRDLEDEARAGGKGRFWMARQMLWWACAFNQLSMEIR